MDANNKRRARLNVISHILDVIPYEHMEMGPVVLPERRGLGEYETPTVAHRWVPERF